MNRVIINNHHKDLNTVISDHRSYANALVSHVCIDVTDEELVFLKLKYNVCTGPMPTYTDMPTYLIPFVYKITRP